jgi:hypothetical protein
MKNLIKLVVLVVLAASMLSAQQYPTDKGSKIVNGGLAYSNAGGDLYEEDKDRVISLAVTPSLSAFVAPGIALGAKAAYAHSAVGDASSSLIGFGPHLALFFTGMQKPAKSEGTTFPYLGAAFLYNIIHSKYTSYTYTYSGYKESKVSHSKNGTTFSFSMGIMHMVTRTLAANVEIAYQVDSIKGNSGNKINFVIGFSGVLY